MLTDSRNSRPARQPVCDGPGSRLTPGSLGSVPERSRDRSRLPVWLRAAVVSLTCAAFAGICILRDAGYGGPHHDEVIALMASKGFEREFARLVTSGAPPFHEIVPAAQWHRFTHDFASTRFSEVRDDVLFGDKHPPLAFWVLNQWLAWFEHGQYAHAVILVWLQMLATAGLLSVAVWQFTRSARWSLWGFVLFLAGNSAIFTATWVRQYSLFAICYALTAICAAELTRPRLTTWRLCGAAAGLGTASWLGMMTQYTFLTMSGPIHLALLVYLVRRSGWNRLALLGIAYAAAGGAFFGLIPRAVQHALVVSEGLERSWHVGTALWGVPQMVIPMPSVLEGWIGSGLGVAVLVAVFALGIQVCRHPRDGNQSNGPEARVVLAGMLGAGALQVSLVAAGFFPGWATSPPHLCALWWLTILAFSIWMSERPSRWMPVFTKLGLIGMIGMQLLYGWHCHQRLLPHVNSSYIASERPDLVCLDNLARGFVLQLTDVMAPEQPVLATQGASLRQHLRDGDLVKYDRILYLPMDETVARDKLATMQVARQAGYTVRDLPVVHPQLYNAVLLEKGGSPPHDTSDDSKVSP